jgi:hypothetical protein
MESIFKDGFCGPKVTGGTCDGYRFHSLETQAAVSSRETLSNQAVLIVDKSAIE